MEVKRDIEWCQLQIDMRIDWIEQERIFMKQKSNPEYENQYIRLKKKEVKALKNKIETLNHLSA